MKIKLTMKSPDAVSRAIREEAEHYVNTVEGLDEYEREDLLDVKTDEISEKLSKWVRYGEYISIEIDTEKGTAVVVPA